MKYNFLRYLVIILLIGGFYLSGCQQPAKKPKAKATVSKKNWDKSIPGNFSTQVKLKLDSVQIDSFFKQYPDVAAYANQVKGFYSNRQLAYAWYDQGQLIEQAGNLANRVMNLQNDGIGKPTPYQKVLDSLIHGAGIPSKTKQIKPDPTLEIMLTAQYFAFAKVAWDGVDVKVSKASGWYVPRKKVAYDQYLDSLLKNPKKTGLAGEPVYRQYDLLKAWLKKYRALAAADDWSPIKINKQILKLGDSTAAVALVKTRLFKLEDFKGDTLNHTYDTVLVNAVKRFQDRHGLAATGNVNKTTLSALNVPLKDRIVKILVNMERSRWLPVTMDKDYLAVNIPEFRLHVYHADSLLWSCRVVVGQTVHPTTVFYGDVKYVVFSPYWNVPPSIVKNEVLPGMKRNPDYLNTHRMEIIGKEDGLPLIRQKPGAANSLGLVKFLFPNSYNIYLHDTPSKSLFGESARAFSHGCIRLGEPVRLANFLLRNDKGWDSLKINTAMHASKEQYVTLRQTVPVFIAYFTSFVDRGNQLNFRDDIYQLDGKLAAAIMTDKD
jgi:murein L,D-transpeptidase YcbB/YkuD